MMTMPPQHEVGSGNVLADIGLPDAETHLLKAQMVSRMQEFLDARHLTLPQNLRSCRPSGVGQAGVYPR